MREESEMEERKKRVNSIFVRGLDTSLNSNTAVAKLGEISNILIGHMVQFSNVQLIKPGLFRMNIMCMQDRKNLLDNCKNLKDTDLSNVFIRRDLTYLQIMELRERRSRMNETPAGHPENDASEDSVNQQDHPTPTPSAPPSNQMQN